MHSIGAAASVPCSFLLAFLGNDIMYSKITESSSPHSWAIQHLVFSMFKVKADVLWFQMTTKWNNLNFNFFTFSLLSLCHFLRIYQVLHCIFNVHFKFHNVVQLKPFFQILLRVSVLSWGIRESRTFSSSTILETVQQELLVQYLSVYTLQLKPILEIFSCEKTSVLI